MQPHGAENDVAQLLNAAILLLLREIAAHMECMAVELRRKHSSVS